MAESNYQILIEMRETIVDYLQEEKTINKKVLAAYEPKPIAEQDQEIRILREKEAIKLRDRITELSRHIAVIKRMFPTNS
jgi:polyhydroxyalkanoate synthesis regulator phasin